MELTDKQKEILLALVEGKEVEYYVYKNWRPLTGLDEVSLYSDENLRVKPETPKDIIVKEYKKYLPCLEDAYDEPNVEYTFCGVTHVLKSVKMLGEGIKGQPTNDGWISNIGNDTERWPDGYGIRSSSKIEIERRNGETEMTSAGDWCSSWREDDNDPWDIVKFRILKD
jgi:hypothetical protein